MKDDKTKCILIHIPKCAGTSIEMLLIGKYLWVNPKTRSEKHFTAIEAKEAYGQDIYDSYYKFTIVRNPFSRILSWYHWNNQGFSDFNEYVKWRCKDGQYRNESMLQYITDEEGNLAVDYVARFETLREDWSKIRQKLGIKAELPHEHKKKYNHDYRTWYTPETRRLVEDKYKEDLDYFGYTW